MNTEPITLHIPDEQAGQPLSVLLPGLFGAEVVAQPLARGGVWLDGRRVGDPHMLVPPGALVTLRRPPTGVYSEVVITSADILYEDEWVLALNKRPGWYTSATPWDIEGNTLAALGRFLRAREGAGNDYLHLAHRLDHGTSGVLLFSRRPEANAPLQVAFASHTARKEYVCLCAGVPNEDTFDLQSGHGRERGGRFRVYPLEQVGTPLPGGTRVKLAYTRFAVLRRLADAALLRAEPRTGRTHQIRLHAAQLGHPLLGDVRYGGPASYAGVPLVFPLLHAALLELPHPGTGALVRLEAAVPSPYNQTADERR